MMTDWIKCNERQPDPKDCVLVLCEDGSQHVVTKDNYLGQGKYVYVTGGWEYCHMCSGQSEIVFYDPDPHQKLAIYWMPLPEPPKE